MSVAALQWLCHCLCLWLPIALASSAAAGEPLRNQIDHWVRQSWEKHQLKPAAPASDAEFLRRVTLDLIGTIPEYPRAVAFLDDTAADKREQLVGELLASPRFGIHQADLWDLIYFGRNPSGFGTDKRDGFHRWLASQFNDNVPYDQWVRELLKARGNTVEQGAPMFFVQYRNSPEDATEAVTQKFLGVQLQCARCHDHPFESWTQRDFYGVAAFLARLQVVDLGNRDKQKAFAIGEMNTGDVLFTGPASEQQPGQKGEPIPPKFLGGAELQAPSLPEGVKDPRNFPNGKEPPAPHFSRKDALADWITAADNPYFARAAANRVWAQLMGRGLVHPVDNMSPNNPPSHPELLDVLARELVAHRFDLKWLIGEIVNSQAYQLSGVGEVSDASPQWYQRARVRPLSAEELLESWMLASGYGQALADAGKREPVQGWISVDDRFRIPGVTWGYMRQFFGEPTDGVGNYQGAINEHLYLNNGQVHQLISDQPGSLKHALQDGDAAWEARVERLFLQVLTRKPTAAEREYFVEQLGNSEDLRRDLHDALWSLMTCSEFRFNH